MVMIYLQPHGDCELANTIKQYIGSVPIFVRSVCSHNKLSFSFATIVDQS